MITGGASVRVTVFPRIEAISKYTPVPFRSWSDLSYERTESTSSVNGVFGKPPSKPWFKTSNPGSAENFYLQLKGYYKK